MSSACRFDWGIGRVEDRAQGRPGDAAGRVVPVAAKPWRAVRRGCRGVADWAWTLPAGWAWVGGAA